jgi:hypothetical protein
MNYFVFVVCGAKEHIQTLNFSLQFIRHFSIYPVLVVTDSTRNELPIEHNNIIDVKTPPELDHHQASIYLKTGLHKQLNMEEGNLYCYLDSDIVAIDENINAIFSEFNSPVTFAKDHCQLDEFSPHAMHCNCLADTLRKNKEYEAVDKFFQQNVFSLLLNEKDRKLLENQFSELQEPRIKSIFMGLHYFFNRYVSPVKKFNFGKFYFNKNTKFWYNSDHELVDFDFQFYEKILRKNTGIRFDYKRKKWLNKYGENITPQTPHCNHLSENIIARYKISIPNDWRHWNGGVFLFNNRSVDFLNFWHQITIREFRNPETKTRDQGTLAVSVWKFNLQESKTLPVNFNFITEFENSDIEYRKDSGFTKDGFKTTFKPYFLHIYHEWGRSGWSIWDYVSELEKTILKTKIN